MKKLSILALVVIAAAASSCRAGMMREPEPDKPPVTVPEAVEFTVQADGFQQVKATDAAFENGDELGIFAGSPISRNNVKAKVSGNSLIPDTQIKWAENQTAGSSFAAYYPYDASITGTEFAFSIKKDQTSLEAYSASDLRASVVGEAKPGTTVAFSMKHILSKLTIALTAEDASEQVESVTINGSAIDASVNLASELSVTAGTAKEALKAGKTAESGFVAVLVPQTVKLTLDVVTSKGRNLAYTLEEPQKLESGFAYRADITIPKETAPVPAVEVTFTITTEDWSSGGALEFVSGDVETPQSHDGQWSVIGLAGDWNTDIWMTETTPGTWEVEITYNEGDSFKLRKDGKWSTETEKHDEAGMPGDATDPVPCDGTEYGLWGEGNKDIVLASPGHYRLVFVTDGYHFYVNPA